jgi:hypothetical protein
MGGVGGKGRTQGTSDKRVITQSASKDEALLLFKYFGTDNQFQTSLI